MQLPVVEQQVVEQRDPSRSETSVGMETKRAVPWWASSWILIGVLVGARLGLDGVWRLESSPGAIGSWNGWLSIATGGILVGGSARWSARLGGGVVAQLVVSLAVVASPALWAIEWQRGFSAVWPLVLLCLALSMLPRSTLGNLSAVTVSALATAGWLASLSLGGPSPQEHLFDGVGWLVIGPVQIALLVSAWLLTVAASRRSVWVASSPVASLALWIAIACLFVLAGLFWRRLEAFAVAALWVSIGGGLGVELMGTSRHARVLQLAAACLLLLQLGVVGWWLVSVQS